MDGYNYQLSKKNNAPVASGLVGQTSNYAKISEGMGEGGQGKEKLHNRLMNISNLLRGQKSDVPKYGA
jgi:hypothetical protein